MAVAYVDANGNGEFDRFAEPSGSCERSESSWQCQIAFQRTTLYRAITSRGDLENDKTFVFWEDFSRDGRPVADSKVCLDARCTAVDKPPFLSASNAPVRVFSICGAEGFAPQDATIEREHQKTTVRVSRPDAPRPSVVARHDNGLRIRVGAPFDRVLVWGGDVDPTTGDVRKVYWTSESSPARIERSNAGVSAVVPEQLLTACGKRRCDIVVQLLAIAHPSNDTLVSETEYRSAIMYSP